MAAVKEQGLREVITDCLTSALSREGIDEDRSQAIIEEVDNQVRQRFGGERLYISRENKRRRNLKIIKEWQAGAAKGYLQKKYEVSARTLDRIISNHLQRATAEQSNGFGSEEWRL